MTAFLVDYKVDPRDRVAGEAEVDFLSRVTVHADWEENYNGTSVVGRHHVTLEDEVGWDVYYSPYGHTDPGLRGGFYPITWYVPTSGPPVRAGLLDMLLLASLAPVQWQPGS